MSAELNARDVVRYMAAASDDRLAGVVHRLVALAAETGSTELAELHHMVMHVRGIIQQSAVLFSPEGLDHARYDDGRKITSAVDLEPPNYYRHVWHPDPLHRENQPHTVVDRYRFPGGAVWSVRVTEPGVLEAICHQDGPG